MTKYNDAAFGRMLVQKMNDDGQWIESHENPKRYTAEEKKKRKERKEKRRLQRAIAFKKRRAANKNRRIQWPKQ